MYCPRRIEERRRKASKRIGFEVEPHSRAESEQAKSHLASLWEPEEGRWIRPLDKKESQFIRNERAMCSCSFSYWATRYARIRDWAGKIVTFSPNIAQRIVMDIWADNENQDRAIAMQQNKARQLGVSTLSELAVAHRAQFYPNVNGVIASADPDKTKKMSEMVRLCYDGQPPWLIGQLRSVIGAIDFPLLKSSISLQAGSQFTGIARGTTPNVAHISELVDFIDPEELIDASLLRAMHETPEMFLMLESTSAGRHNWWHRLWEYSIQNWSLGRSKLRPNFFPWFIGRDIYPTPAWLRARPIPADWRPFDVTLAHAERAAEYVHNTPLLAKYLGSNWRMPREQMWFYEVEREEHRAKKELNKFLSEMPASAQESFQSTNISAFDTDTVESYRSEARLPLGIYGIQGTRAEIPQRLLPSERLWENKPAIPVKAKWSENQRSYEFKLIPLAMEGYPNTIDWTNKLFVWEMPEEGEVYGLGIDTGDGVGQDRSVINVLRKGNLMRNDRLVASWASPYVNSYDLWPIAMAIGTFYSVKRDDHLLQPKAVIETNKNGEAVQLELKKRGWTRFHIWQRYDRKKLSEAHSQIIGWRTVSWSRTLVMDLLLKYIRDGWIEIDDPFFIDEMADLERDENRQSLKAMYGAFDDRIMALGIVLVSLHFTEVRGQEKAAAIERVGRQSGEKEYPKYHPGFQGKDWNRDEFEVPSVQIMRDWDGPLF
jgi:hypothetical protein